MTEQKKSNIDSWHSEVIKTPEPEEFGRRDFLKAAKIAGGATLLILAANEVYKVARSMGYFIPETSGEPAPPISKEEAALIETQIAPTQEPTPFAPSPSTPEPTREPIVQREGEFAGIIFREGSSPIDMTIVHDEKTIPVPPFTPIKFYRGLYGDEFKPTVAWWRDGGGRLQLDGDSGWYPKDEERVGFTFTPWQLALEEKPVEGNPEQTVRISPAVVDKTILEEFINRRVIMRQDKVTSSVKIVAGARVPPPLIPASKQNIADIVKWLAPTFPDHGFEQVLQEDPWKILVVKFCGRNLSGEDPETSMRLSSEESLMRQARFFFVFKSA